MKTANHRPASGFTLIEILMAMAIFALAMISIYATLRTVLSGSKVGLEAAAQVQRERVAIHTIEEALTSSRSFAADLQHYSFVAKNGSDAMLSFVARLPHSFPRSGKFGDFDVRRISFSIESGPESSSELVMRQSPILMEFDEDEQNHPLVLARNMKEMSLEFWDPQTGDWIDTWTQTNQLPKMVKVTLQLQSPNQRSYSSVHEEITRIVSLPSIMVPAAVQTPNVGNQQGGQGFQGGQGAKGNQIIKGVQ